MPKCNAIDYTLVFVKIIDYDYISVFVNMIDYDYPVEPIIIPQLPRKQADFRRSRSTVDQVTLLPQKIEDNYSGGAELSSHFKVFSTETAESLKNSKTPTFSEKSTFFSSDAETFKQYYF